MAIIPNGAISNGSLVNLSLRNQLRVDLTIGISYDSDIKKAKDLLIEIMASNPKVLKDPAPIVAVSVYDNKSKKKFSLRS